MQMQRLICEAREEASEMRAHAAHLVVERAVEEAHSEDARQALAEMGSRVASMSAAVEQVELQLSSAAFGAALGVKMVEALVQRQAAADALAIQRSEALAECMTQQEQQTETIAALQADKIQLTFSVQTKLDCLIAVEQENLSLRRQMEINQNECGQEQEEEGREDEDEDLVNSSMYYTARTQHSSLSRSALEVDDHEKRRTASTLDTDGLQVESGITKEIGLLEEKADFLQHTMQSVMLTLEQRQRWQHAHASRLTAALKTIKVSCFSRARLH